VPERNGGVARTLSLAHDADHVRRLSHYGDRDGVRAAPVPVLPPADRTGHDKPQKRGKAEQPDPLRNLEGRAANLRATGRVRAYEDILWTLLNSSEFVLNH